MMQQTQQQAVNPGMMSNLNSPGKQSNAQNVVNSHANVIQHPNANRQQQIIIQQQQPVSGNVVYNQQTSQNGPTAMQIQQPNQRIMATGNMGSASPHPTPTTTPNPNINTYNGELTNGDSNNAAWQSQQQNANNYQINSQIVNRSNVVMNNVVGSPLANPVVTSGTASPGLQYQQQPQQYVGTPAGHQNTGKIHIFFTLIGKSRVYLRQQKSF